MKNTPGENNNQQPPKPEGNQLPDGFRLVEEGEVLPPGYETRMDLTLQRSITNAPKEAPKAAQQFPEPKILEATVNPNTPVKEKPQAFSFTSPKVIQKAQAQPTKGDVANQEQSQQKASESAQSNADKLRQLDEEIKRDEAGDKKDYTYDDYKDTAEMFVEGWEGFMSMICQAISKDSSPTAYCFPQPTKEKLIRQGTKVSRKRNWVVPIEGLFLGNLMPATARNVMKATDKRKEYMAKRRQEEAENRPAETNKGGPEKGQIKTRGPGRPRK